jgi:formylmethanofuran dehydrogenase subunit E
MTARVIDITGRIRELPPKRLLHAGAECARCGELLTAEEQLLNTKTWEITCATCAKRETSR